MDLAVEQAHAALLHDDVPVGAIVVHDNDVIAARHNERELTGDPSAHAEVLALRDAADHLGSWRLDDCTLYVTLEPCAMCAGAIAHARIARLYYGADDAKGGAVAHGPRLFEQSTLHHKPEVYAGIAADESAALLKKFFAERR